MANAKIKLRVAFLARIYTYPATRAQGIEINPLSDE